MKSTIRYILALTLVSAPVITAHGHGSHQRLHELHRRFESSHKHERQAEPSHRVDERAATCALPDDPNIVAITPNEANGGWAMSPDLSCKADGSWCPYACKPGMVMAQWEPDSTYTYPQSMNGGLQCGSDGKAKKPFPNKPYCVPGVGNVEVVNKLGKPHSWCQTVLPGSESMLIPTLVESTATLAVPDTDYWCSTAAHFYINGPGSGAEDCKWGDSSSPIGNWSPLVAGTNKDSTGNTFIKLAWNPIYIGSALAGKKPDFGVEIKCTGGECNGLPCKIDPRDGLNRIDGDGTGGVGGANFCVVTVPSGTKAQFVVFSTDGSGSSSSGSDSDGGMGIEAVASSSSSSSASKSTSSSKTSTTTTSTTTSTSTSTSTTSTTTSTTTTSTTSTTTTSTSSSTHTTTKKKTSTIGRGGIFHENDSTPTPQMSTPKPSSTALSVQPSGTSSGSSPPPTVSQKDGAAVRQQSNAALVGLVVAFVATAYFF